MNQITLFDYCIHFVENLPDHQGKDGKPVILFLDSNSSRRDVSSLLYLVQNNALPLSPIPHINLDPTKRQWYQHMLG